jgi:hypothetical protein
MRRALPAAEEKLHQGEREETPHQRALYPRLLNISVKQHKDAEFGD